MYTNQPCGDSSCSERQVVRQVKEMPRLLPAVVMEMSFETEELWGLHLGREGPAHTAEDGVVMEGIYFLCLGRCTMVLPENHIPLRIYQTHTV